MRGAWLAIGMLVAIACGGVTNGGSADGGAGTGAGGAGMGGRGAGTGGASAGTGGASAGTGGASAGTGGGGAGIGADGGTGGIDCVPMAYCDGDTLMVDESEFPPCDPYPIPCPDGCVGDGSYPGAVCAVRCGGALCPVPPGMGYFWSNPCCTDAGQCGFSPYRTFNCLQFDLPGVVDPACPGSAGTPGCCLPGNVCGVMGSFGCEGRNVAPVHCDTAPGDAGTDATPDAAAADATPD